MFSVCKDILYAHIPEIDHGQCHLDLYLPQTDPGSANDGREFEHQPTDGKCDSQDLQLKPMVTQGEIKWSEFKKCVEDGNYSADINGHGRKRGRSGVPFVLFFHGGGWRRGGRAAWTHYLYFDVNFLVAFMQFVIGTYGNIGETLARNKIACAIVSYPLTEAGALTLLAEMVCSYIMSTLFVLFVTMPILGLLVLFQLVSNSSHNTWKLMFKTDYSNFIAGLILIMILTNLIKALLFITRRKQFNISSNLLSCYCLIGTIELLISYRTQSLLVLMVSTLILNEGVLFYLRRQRHGASYKQQVQAVVQAIKWAKRFSEEHYYTDPERLYLMGHSAGGHLATLSALDHSALTSVSCSSADLKGIISISGVYDLLCLNTHLLRPIYLLPTFGRNPAKWLSASPQHRAKQTTSSETTPKFLLILAEKDLFLRAQSFQFAKTLKELDYDCQHVEIEKTNHFNIITNTSIGEGTTLSYVLAFVQ